MPANAIYVGRPTVWGNVEFENRERWGEEDTRPGKPVIVGCYHYSNFEWLSIVSAFAGLEGVVIAQQFKNPLLDPIFLKLRQRSGHRVVPRKRAVTHLYPSDTKLRAGVPEIKWLTLKSWHSS